MTNFVSLHNQTDFSILDSIISPKALFARAKELGQSAIAVTDHGTLAGAWDALKASRDYDVKLIIGCECYFLDDASKNNDKFRHIILIAKNAIGYRNLLTINKKGFDQGNFLGKRVYPIVDWKLLEQYNEGIICLTACGNGIISQLLMNKKFDEANQTLLKLKVLFGDNLGIEVQPNNMKRGSNFYNDEIDQQFLNRRLIDLGKTHNVRVVPACNTHYLKKEDARIHDAFLAIGSHQPIHSNFRLKYNVDEFYLKTGEEIVTFFSRNYGEDYAKEICANSIYFADMCEKPDWIDPKFSNPSGKELPIFPVKDELDYSEFLVWLSSQSEEVQKLDEDKQYLRFKCEEIFLLKTPSDKISEYRDRLEEELDVIYDRDISSYILIVMDFIRYCRQNKISVGPGRGCLTGDTMVLTSKGFKNLKDIKIGELVYTHTGKLRKVLNTFEFSVENEPLLKISTNNSYKSLVMTKDHKLYASIKKQEKKTYSYLYGKTTCQKSIDPNYPEWIPAENLNKLDYIFSTSPIRKLNNNLPIIDLNKYNSIYEVENDYLNQSYFLRNKLSIRDICKSTNLSFEFVRNRKNNKNLCLNEGNNNKVKVLNNYLENTHQISIENWASLETKKVRKIKRYLVQDENFMYFVGRWIGDGSFHGSRGISIVFNSKDTVGVDKIKNYLEDLGFYVCKEDRVNNNTLLTVSNELVYKLFAEMFPSYYKTRNANAKTLPINFRSFNDKLLLSLVTGVFDADGSSIKCGKKITTVSKSLVFELKEVFTFIKIPSTIYHYTNIKRYQVPTQDQYNIHFRFDDKINSFTNNGHFNKISKIEEVFCDKVYDITVDKDHSYLTTNGVVHNSVGGCLVAYLLDIHQADPIKYGLVFPRFFNKLKKDYSDIDSDFSKANRSKVIEYIVNKYGKDNVAQISNVITMTPKVYIKDIVRACELGESREESVSLGNDIASHVPADASNINEAINNIPILSEYARKYPDLIKYIPIAGKQRAVGLHAAGIIVGSRTLHEIVPIRKDKDGNSVVEYDKNLAEENGLVKIDILGLNTLDIIDETCRLIIKNKKDISKINYEEYDKKTYDLISSGDTFGVFQFGTSAGTIDLCKKIKPTSIEDLAIITTIARPASKEIRNDFIKTRRGDKKITLLHPSLANAFSKTYGFPIYDESLLVLAKDVAGWDLAEADKLRKLTKGKGKDQKNALQWRKEFIEGSINNGLSNEDAEKIWEQVVEPFGKYSFNKSHAVLYSMVSYHTAYLKAHFPVEFLLANLMSEVKSNSPDSVSNIQKIKKELKNKNIKLLPPDINSSELTYTITDGDKLLTGLDALKFVGDDAIKDIIEKRPFKNFFDFMVRVDSKKVRSNSIQALASVGAMDSFRIPRKLIYLYVSDYRKKLQVWLKKHDPSKEEFIYPWPAELDWSIPELYALEQFYLGESFICKPAVAYGKFFSDSHITIYDIKKEKDKTKIRPVKGIIRDYFEFKVKKETSKYYGQSMVKATFEDKNGEQCSCTIFPDRWKLVTERLKSINSKAEFGSGLAISFAGSTNSYEDDIGVILDDVYDLALVPTLPADLKAKKINLKEAKSKTILKSIENKNDLVENLEDILYDEGLIDLDNEENND